jgi:hypothetical protein
MFHKIVKMREQKGFCSLIYVKRYLSITLNLKSNQADLNMRDGF